MPNHIHILWRINEKIKKSDFQRDFLKFTARSILKFMLMNDDPMLASLKVNDADREYQVWERNALSMVVYQLTFFLQKLNYIHNNPLQAHWQLSDLPENYFYSSAKFYETGVDDFKILTHYNE
jgi:REP element-mobilizing transposase RayT